MPAGVYNIRAEQGANFSLHLQYSDAADLVIDMSQYTARMQVKRSPEKEKSVLFLTNTGVTGAKMAVFSADAMRIAMQKNVDLEIGRRPEAVGNDVVASLHAGVGLIDAGRGVLIKDAA